ncbi:MAG: MBL fold metallo-hydrolase [Gammaproteobacteria bacterium]|nr:MBL fold metallo-hydrolase [Gammaproteobacteria bacterium]
MCLSHIKPAFHAAMVVLCLAAPTVNADNNHARDHHQEKLAVNEVKGNLSVMVLGSGGPMAAAAGSGRASAGYLIFVEGVPRVLMDVGGGTYQRLAESGATIPDLDIILLSHLHIDHTGDLSPMIKTLYFHRRATGIPRPASKPVRIWGPGATNIPFPGTTVAQYPSCEEYVDGHYAMPGGVERYLKAFVPSISAGEFAYTATNLSPFTTDQMQTVLDEDGLVIKSIGVIHGHPPGNLVVSTVPALAFRIEYKGKSIVYSGDTSSLTNNMITIAHDADLLIYDTSITDTQPSLSANPADAVFYALHTTPTRMGQVASAAKPKTLVLSHITPITETRLDEVQQSIRAQGYTGRISVATDLKVYNLDD